MRKSERGEEAGAASPRLSVAGWHGADKARCSDCAGGEIGFVSSLSNFPFSLTLSRSWRKKAGLKSEYRANDVVAGTAILIVAAHTAVGTRTEDPREVVIILGRRPNMLIVAY